MIQRLVLFDVDGTLLDAGGSGRWALSRAFEEVFGIADAEPFTRQVAFDGMTDPEIHAAIARNASLSESRVRGSSSELQRSFLSHLERRLSGAVARRALPGVVDLLDGLAGVNGAAVGLATGNIEAGARLKLASVGLAERFDLGGFGGDAPDRAGIGRVARERFETASGEPIDPRAVILVGDSVQDVLAARANGYRSLAVGTGWTPPERLKAQEPDLYLDDLGDYGGVMRFLFGSRG